MADPRFPAVERSVVNRPYDHPQTLYGGARDLPRIADTQSPSAQSQSPIDPREVVNVKDLLRFAKILSTTTNPANNVSNKFLDAPIGYRNYLAFRNSNGAANIYIEFGKDATTLSVLKLAPGSIILLDTVISQDDIYAMADAVGATLSYSYSNIRF